MCIMTLYSELPWSMITQFPAYAITGSWSGLYQLDVRFLSRVRVSGYVIAGVDHGSSRRRKDLAAPARIRRILVGVA